MQNLLFCPALSKRIALDLQSDLGIFSAIITAYFKTKGNYEKANKDK